MGRRDKRKEAGLGRSILGGMREAGGTNATQRFSAIHRKRKVRRSSRFCGEIIIHV